MSALQKKIVNLAEDILDYRELPLISLLLAKSSQRLPQKLKHYLIQYKHKKIRAYIDHTIPFISPIPKCLPVPSNGKEPIWFFWHQGKDNMPAIPSLCYQYLLRNSRKHPVIFLSESNWRDYTSLPEFIVNAVNNGKISMAHFSDFLRLSLLRDYGGLWLDATILLISPIDEQIFNMPFWSIKIPPLEGFVSECRWSVFALGGTVANLAWKVLFDNFVKCVQTNINFIDYLLLDYLIDQLIRRDIIFTQQIQKIPICSPNLYSMVRLLPLPFKFKTYHQLITGTSMFKLNWKQYPNDILFQDSNNYYYYLLKQIEN